MLDQVVAAVGAAEHLRKQFKSVKGAQIFSTAFRGQLKEFAAHGLRQLVPELAKAGDLHEHVMELKHSLATLYDIAGKNCSTAKAKELVTSIKSNLSRIERDIVAGVAAPPVATANEADRLIVETLRDICPSAAASYDQAVRDLADMSRVSWRGTANELREALRETLDLLAPDEEVAAGPGFKAEDGQKRPTYRQKARYILKSRGASGNQLQAPEDAITGIDSLVRSVYTRSNVSAHAKSEQVEVRRILGYVRAVLCDLLELPI